MAKRVSEEKYAGMYQKLADYQDFEHKRNLKKIKVGIWLLWLIPILFLLLLFITNSNKILFLVFWIVSLFGIATYLIIVEYRDHCLQKAMNEIKGEVDAEYENLLDLDIEERQERVAKAVEAAKEAREAKREAVIEAAKERPIVKKVEKKKQKRKSKKAEQKEQKTSEENTESNLDGHKENIK